MADRWSYQILINDFERRMTEDFEYGNIKLRNIEDYITIVEKINGPDALSEGMKLKLRVYHASKYQPRSDESCRVEPYVKEYKES